MVNETASATVIKMSPPVKIVGTGVNGIGKLPEAGGQKLPLTGNLQPQPVQVSVDIRAAIGEINEFVQSVQRDLSFKMDETSGQTVIRVIDRESGALIRQIPSEDVLAIASYIRDAREITVGQDGAPTGLLFSGST